MRDLGSPVHSKLFIREVLREFDQSAGVIMVYKDTEPVACSVTIGFKDVRQNPWASSLRKYSRLAPNMLLYWSMLEYACNRGYRHFDFGRSSPDEGTYRFKKQWGISPCPLNWHYILVNGTQNVTDGEEKKQTFGKAIEIWQKVPVPITQVVGPMVRKHTSL